MRLVQRNGKFGLQKSICGLPYFGKFQDLEPGFEWAAWGRDSRHFYSCWGSEYEVTACLERIAAKKADKKRFKIEQVRVNKVSFVSYIEPNFCERLRIRLLKLVGINRGNSGIVANG